MMENKTEHWMKVVQLILYCLLIGSFFVFIAGELFLPSENVSEGSTFHVFEKDWVQVMPDGTEAPVEVPGICDVDYGEWGVISTVLSPEQQKTWICIRSMQQELKIYVEDELRKEYSTLDTQLFGKTSTLTYVFFPLYEADAGKELRIEFMSKSAYSNYISEMYAGDKTDIRGHFLEMYMPGFMVALLMLIISLFVAVCSMVIQFFYKRKVDLLYLGSAILIASTWLIVESKIRQFIFPNTTMAMWMGFLMIAILPYPFLSYINSVQSGRYQKVYLLIAIATAINFVVTVVLQLLNIKDFFEIMISSHIIIVLLIMSMGGTIICDGIKGNLKEYSEVVFGFAAMMVAGICEVSLVYVVDTQINGIALCVGLILLLFTATLKTVRDLLNVEKERQMAIAASESKAKFLANMSHEIRTPINVVIGMNEMILRENSDETIAEYANNIDSASRMLLGLINDVLDFSKIEAGKLQIVESDYFLATMLNDVILGANVRAKQKNLKVHLDIDETMPSVLKGDEIRIKQILTNLLSNAVKYTEKGSVIFSAKGFFEEGRFFLQFAVKDTGIGINQEDMEKLFSSFERLELSKNRYIQGTGLGLNITKQLVDIMNGTIEVQSKHGEGSCFTVRIPQEIVDSSAMGAPRSRRSEEKEEKSSEFHLVAPDAKILAVDDNKMNLMVIRGLLKSTQVQLDMASSGNECLQMTKKKKYDLILMDHMMPEPDGIQTLHMMRDDEDNLNTETAVIVLTANAIEGMREQYLAEGFVDYLTKPVEAGRLEEMIAKYLQYEREKL